jgi:hypothetical protein
VTIRRWSSTKDIYFRKTILLMTTSSSAASCNAISRTASTAAMLAAMPTQNSRECSLCSSSTVNRMQQRLTAGTGAHISMAGNRRVRYRLYTHALLSCTLLMHSSHALLPRTPLIHFLSYIASLYAPPLLHTGGEGQESSGGSDGRRGLQGG